MTFEFLFGLSSFIGEVVSSSFLGFLPALLLHQAFLLNLLSNLLLLQNFHHLILHLLPHPPFILQIHQDCQTFNQTSQVLHQHFSFSKNCKFKIQALDHLAQESLNQFYSFPPFLFPFFFSLEVLQQTLILPFLVHIDSIQCLLSPF